MIKDIKDLRIYVLACEISDEVWSLVSEWKAFKKTPLGHKWFVRPIPSEPIFPKDMEDIISKKILTFCIMPGDQQENLFTGWSEHIKEA